jgi:uncharacterized protein (DUF2141 family)
MLRKLLLLFVGFALLFSVALAEENYTLSGEVTFRKDGDIYICLLNMEGWRDFQTPGHELTSQKCKVIKMNADLKAAKKVSFKFDSVPKGTYCIVALQDVNNNGKVEFENYVISEPWGSYRELGSGEVAWALAESIQGVWTGAPYRQNAHRLLQG